MKHLIFFFHILSFLAGFTGIILSIFTYVKYKTKVIKHYIIFMIALTTVLLGQTLTSYDIINIVQSLSLKVILNIVTYIAIGFIIYFLPLFAHEFVERDWTSRKKGFFLVVTFIPICFLVIYYITPYKNLMIILSSSILFLVIFYTLEFLGFNYKYIKSKYKKKILRTFLIITVIFLPYIYLDTKTEQIAFLARLFPYGLLSLPIFYMFWNLFCIYYGVNYFKDNINKFYSLENQKDTKGVQEKQGLFFKEFNITNREKEIILLLIKGYSYNQLAEELVISLTTVKTHVHNIYVKAGVKNKIQLIQLINGEKNM